jgi:hypothetical protein
MKFAHIIKEERRFVLGSSNYFREKGRDAK